MQCQTALVTGRGDPGTECPVRVGKASCKTEDSILSSLYTDFV